MGISKPNCLLHMPAHTAVQASSVCMSIVATHVEHTAELPHQNMSFQELFHQTKSSQERLHQKVSSQALEELPEPGSEPLSGMLHLIMRALRLMGACMS